MSDETTFDPWDAPAEEPAIDLDGGDEDLAVGEFDDILDEIELDEEESGEAVQARDERKVYSDPRDVGLLDKMWVPIRLTSPTVDEKFVPRLSSKTCIAQKDGKTYVLFDQVEAMLKAGATEKIAEVPLPYFIVQANHVAPRFGRRRFDYEIEVPVFTIKTAFFKPQGNRTGGPNEQGRALRVASGATAAGDRVNKANMHEVAERMDEQVVMAQINVVTSKKPKFRDRLDENGDRINVLVDPETGDAVLVVKVDESGGYVYAETGEVADVNEALLVHVLDQKYAIRDNGDSSDVLKEKYFPVNDYLSMWQPFQPVPERKVVIERLDGSEAEGEITWDTVGGIALGANAGAKVDVLLKGTGEIVTAVWLGTQWNEVPGQSGGTDEYTG